LPSTVSLNLQHGPTADKQSIFPLSRLSVDMLVPTTPVSVKPATSLPLRESRARYFGAQLTDSIESSFEDSNHNIHTSQDTMNHPEFSFDHMKQYVSSTGLVI
jgi:hypothetical protein